MGKSQVTNQFEVDTGGSCFMCFKEIRPQGKSTEKTSSDENDSNVEEEGLKKDSKRRGSGLSSLQVLSRYLKLNMETVINSETTTIPVQLLPTVQKSELKVSLCGDCSDVTGKCSDALEELEKLKLYLDHYLTTILGKLRMAEGDAKTKQGYWDKIVGCPQAAMHAGIVEKLREETVKKCSKKVENMFPQLRMDRVICLPADGGVPLPSTKKSKSDPVPIKSSVKGVKAEMKEAKEVILSSEISKNKSKRKVQRVRPIKVSSSSSSSSDSDDGVVTRLRSRLSTGNLRNISNDAIPSMPAYERRLKQDRSMNAYFEANRKRLAESIQKSLDEQMPQPPSSVQQKDDPVKRLYPFKCLTCRKRFKEEDTFMSHEHPVSSNGELVAVSSDSDSTTDSDSDCSETQPIEVAKYLSLSFNSSQPSSYVKNVKDTSSNQTPQSTQPKDVVILKIVKKTENEKTVRTSQKAKQLAPKKKKQMESESKKKTIKIKKKKISIKKITDMAKKAMAIQTEKESSRMKNKQKMAINNKKKRRRDRTQVNCPHCACKFRSEFRLRRHVATKHDELNIKCLDTEAQSRQSDPSVPIPEPEDNFKIEYILPNDPDEDMRVPDVADQANQHVSDSQNQLIEELLQVPPNVASGSFEECDSFCNDDGVMSTTVSGKNSDDEQKPEIPSDCIVKKDTTSNVEEKKPWTSIGAGFRGVLSPDEQIEQNPSSLLTDSKDNISIVLDQIDQDFVPMITDDNGVEVQKIRITTSLAASPLPLQQPVNCVQPLRES